MLYNTALTKAKNQVKQPTHQPRKRTDRRRFSRRSLSKVMWRWEKIMLPMMNGDGCPSDRSFRQSAIPPVLLVPSVPFVSPRLFITRRAGSHSATLSYTISSKDHSGDHNPPKAGGEMPGQIMGNVAKLGMSHKTLPLRQGECPGGARGYDFASCHTPPAFGHPLYLRGGAIIPKISSPTLRHYISVGS